MDVPGAQANTALYGGGESSDFIPTFEYFNKNFTKTELQKQCRERGLNKIWVTKDKLIEMLLAEYNSSVPKENEGRPRTWHQPQDRNLLHELDIMEEELLKKTSEIEQLNEILQAANVTINKLNDRLSTLEERVERNERRCTETTHPSSSSTSRLPTGSTSGSQNNKPEGTLLLGDTNLTNVRATDLGRQCYVRTINGGNIDLIRCWVAEKLNWMPSRCILVCGIHDILDEVNPSKILDDLGALVAELKKINENMEIHICELLPTLQQEEFGEKIEYYNGQLLEWSSKNGVSIIRCKLSFKLGNGEVDDLCYRVDGVLRGVFLNRWGIIRLLSTLTKLCDGFMLCENWEEIKRAYSHETSRPVHSEQVVNRLPFELTSRPTFSYQNYDRPTRHFRRNSNQNKNKNSHTESLRGEFRTENVNSDRYKVRNERRGRGCVNCGELNHTVNLCRFDQKLKCGSCSRLGHKSKLCRYFTS